MKDDDAIDPNTHEIEHLAVIFQLSYGGTEDLWVQTSKLGELTRMSGQSVTIAIRKITSFLQEVRAIVKGVAVFLV